MNQFDVYLMKLDPVIGSEMKKTRPCVVVSPNSMNKTVKTAIIAPFTSSMKNYPMRVKSKFSDQDGFIALDHMRSVDQRRGIKKLGVLDDDTAAKTLIVLQEMFS